MCSAEKKIGRIRFPGMNWKPQRGSPGPAISLSSSCVMNFRPLRTGSEARAGVGRTGEWKSVEGSVGKTRELLGGGKSFEKKTKAKAESGLGLQWYEV